ncbi:tellurite resistance protein TehB [Leptospira ryugenii]|uniref:Tellurite resistance protein TehB n=1 Tax=Leptospira ryugenii TaxID=1917863 RepID=A0A2P2DXK5_9LEPT|nr:tellurite resistance protein TehB [Leptospira ryugenii]
MDTFLTTHGITLFFYDEISVHSEFHKYGLVECKEIQEPKITSENKPPEIFYYIICQKVPA